MCTTTGVIRHSMTPRLGLRSSNFCRSPAPKTGARHLWAALALGVCLIRPAYPIDPGRAMSQYVHNRWGPEQGFPPGPVYAITQTTDGYLWIGTEAGLVRFDGWNFQIIKDDSGSYTITSVLGLAPDDAGCLWIRLQDLSVIRYCHGVFERPAGDVARYSGVEAMQQGGAGELLIWNTEDGAVAFQRRSPRKLVSVTRLPRSPVLALTRTPNGDVWMGTRDAGLFRFSGGKLLSIRNGLPDLKVNCLLPDGERGLWVGTDAGIAHWNGTKFTAVGIPSTLRRFQALALVRDRDGNVWAGTDSQGLFRLNSRGFASLQEGDAPVPEAITALFEDREGNLWIGHAGGIERLRDSAFVTYSLPEGLPTDGSNPVFVDSGNRMWFPPVAGGLWWSKDGKLGRVTNDGLDRDVVYSIDGKPGELWLGRQHGGLTQLRFHGASFLARTYTQSDGLAENSVYSVYVAHDDSVWAGTLSRGVTVLRDGKFKSYTADDGLASNTVASILESADGTMWFATPGGLSALANGHWRSFSVRDGLPSDNVNCLFQDSAGVLWAGTGFGLAFRRTEEFEVPTGMPEALREPVFGLAEDRYGWLWMTTSSHVLRVNRSKLLSGTLGDADVREYGPADGLRGVEGVKRHRSVIADPAGRIWISLNRGISVVDPARLTRNLAPAIVHFQSIQDDNRLVPSAKAVHIPGGHHRLTLTFVGLSLSVPEAVQYRYMLEGFDRGWVGPTAAREAVYTNLPPGSYRFRVMASNPDGEWSPAVADAAFEVDPLFWQTGWFLIGSILACGLAAVALYRLRLRQLTRRLNLRFEERLAERTRIAQELHDTLLQGFISASMQVHVAAEGLAADSREKPMLARALQLMRQVIDEGRNSVRGLRSSQNASLDLEQAFARIQQEFPSQGAGSQPEFRVIVDGERKKLHPLLRDDMYRIGREAVINAFRHARARKIEVELRYFPHQFSILVRDDGRGIDPEILKSGRDGHWGLPGMQERANQIHARLHVRSRAAAGTEVELSVPGHLAFQGHPKRA
jgi:signal transduction histidine kinase/ligand-binding sensor domain-containing protein